MSAKPKSILIVDDDEQTRNQLAAKLRREYRVVWAPSGESAMAMLTREEAEIVLVNVRLPGISGLEVLKLVRENYPLTEVVMVSAESDIETAVWAMKHGAYHYITRDVEDEALLSVVRNAGEHQDLNRQILTLNAQVADADREFLVGPGGPMREAVELAHKIAKLSATVLILGESGTGKELLARLIHREGDHPTAPFVTANLAAIPRELVESTLFGHEKGAFTGAHRQVLGKFELASGGTLFLDEIGDLRPDLQSKLLRAIQEGEVERVGGTKPIRTEFRLIAATNVDLERAVKEGRFREDLYYRINVVPIRLPPLRERPEDVPELALFFLRRYSARFRKQVDGIADPAMAVLKSYWWPGNVRELENVIERIVAVTDREWITEEDLPLEYQVTRLETGAGDQASLLQRATATFERNFILKALEKSGWNVTGTARYLGVPLSTLKHKIDKLDIRPLARRLRGE